MAEMTLNKKHPLYQEDIDRVLSIKGLEIFKGKRFLITGATGLIGVHLIDVLMHLGQVRVIAVGRNEDNARKRLGECFGNSDFSYIEQDVINPFSKELEVDYIIPLASNTHPLAYSKYPVETIMINVKGAEHALNLARECGATVLYPSSVEVYGNSDSQEPIREDYTGSLTLSNARSCYTESKRVCEAMCQSYLAESGVNTKIVRLSRVFGPTMLESDSKASSQFIKNAIAGEDIILKSEGNQLFSYTYVAEAVAAMLCVLCFGEVGVAYNISSEKCNVRLKDFAQICAGCVGKDVVFDFPTSVEFKGYSVAMNAVLDNSRLKSLGFDSMYEFPDSVYRTIEILKY